jgi:DNA-directed RNA polymerase specialized sigma24 family protein
MTKNHSDSCDVLRPGALAREREAVLIQRLQHRDPTALGELYDLYGRLTCSVILRIVHDAGIAEDLVQETFLCIWTRIRLFNSQRGAVGP